MSSSPWSVDAADISLALRSVLVLIIFEIMAYTMVDSTTTLKQLLDKIKAQKSPPRAPALFLDFEGGASGLPESISILSLLLSS